MAKGKRLKAAPRADAKGQHSERLRITVSPGKVRNRVKLVIAHTTVIQEGKEKRSETIEKEDEFTPGSAFFKAISDHVTGFVENMPEPPAEGQKTLPTE